MSTTITSADDPQAHGTPADESSRPVRRAVQRLREKLTLERVEAWLPVLSRVIGLVLCLTGHETVGITLINAKDPGGDADNRK
ncbi:hypothetical protein [Streptomyces alkaliphilus]|uniref:hypothetical protein n=1 Tax=Streptomyces alkaliphilus TaxID=1472722 RepID=UPI001180790A|nr:hypothetical protein [Streptomyces alkaliphilus]MQS08874.1 hypothetical protein [Streptomyces alkaliphilus]